MFCGVTGADVILVEGGDWKWPLQDSNTYSQQTQMKYLDGMKVFFCLGRTVKRTLENENKVVTTY